MVMFPGHPKPFPGTITRVNKNNTYSVLYDDKDRRTKVPGSEIYKDCHMTRETLKKCGIPTDEITNQKKLVKQFETLNQQNQRNDLGCWMPSKKGMEDQVEAFNALNLVRSQYNHEEY